MECDECERDLARHEGPRSARDYFCQAASVLNRVGMGDSYRAAAQHARRLDHRLARKKPRYPRLLTIRPSGRGLGRGLRSRPMADTCASGLAVGGLPTARRNRVP